MNGGDDALSAVRARWEPARSAPGLEAAWRALEGDARSPFHAWAWVSNWLQTLPPGVDVQLFRADDDAGPLALGLFGVRPERGARRLFGDASLWLQETGDRALDEVTVEYMGLLTRPGAEARAYRAFAASLARERPRTRQVWISACEHAALLAANLPRALDAYGFNHRASYFVDLDRLRADGRAYVDALSASTRASMRRAARAYAALGPLTAEVATDAAQALAMLDELEALHTAYWRSRGHAGAFGSDYFRDFHHRLIAQEVPGGLPRLVRFKAGASTLGVAYYLRWRGRDFFYNSGFDYGLVPRDARPGAVAHLLGVELSLGDGMAAYDFMAGDADYKRMFSTHAFDVCCVQLRRAGLRARGERLAQRLLGRAPPMPLADSAPGTAVRAVR
jgi:CelD/BcsL family acetyltransferase involved in cellulose biosynthesis